MAKGQKTAIKPTRNDDYSEWYQQVIKAADMAENSPVRGCMVIKPWGYGIWEKLKAELDEQIKFTGHENAYFPLFIPLSFLEKEAEHVEGFAKECAIVTHHRLEEEDGRLVPKAPLDDPLVVRPTSETIIGHSFSRWIQSYRDLPLLINQWANVVRWEMRPRLFLRTAEFLWQEGHTAHATDDEGRLEAEKMLGVYKDICENILAMPVICGEKSPAERFPGAVSTYCIEAMMQDRKALQAGTSHYLGQNFAKAFDIKFCDRDGKQEYAYMTSWGVTTRLIGGMIMSHSDDDGLRLPPRVAPKHVVIIPFLNKNNNSSGVLEYVDKVAAKLKSCTYHGRALDVIVDDRDLRGGEKNWHWIKKGIPLRIEIGSRDLENGVVTLARRDQDHSDKQQITIDELASSVALILDDIQDNYLKQAQENLQNYTYDNIRDYESFKEFFTPLNKNKPEIHGGFVKAKWCGKAECEEKVADIKVSIRCLPLDQSGSEGCCVVCGDKAKIDAIYAKAY